MTSTELTSSGKRKRSQDDASLLEAANITNLPSAALVHIASYSESPPISRALLAVAIATDAESLSQDSIATAVAGGDWATLDFGDVEKELAAKLSDADISGVLRCIDAVNTVKKLKLTNCIGITGSCLEPLRNSRTVEVIDLSLVREHESPALAPEPPLSCDAVLPILDSILVVGVKLVLIQFPKAWRQEPLSEDFDEFLQRYHGFFDRGDYYCEECGERSLPEPQHVGDNKGILCSTCHGCLNHYCSAFSCKDELKFCCFSERYYCKECSKTQQATKKKVAEDALEKAVEYIVSSSKLDPYDIQEDQNFQRLKQDAIKANAPDNSIDTEMSLDVAVFAKGIKIETGKSDPDARATAALFKKCMAENDMNFWEKLKKSRLASRERNGHSNDKETK